MLISPLVHEHPQPRTKKFNRAATKNNLQCAEHSGLTDQAADADTPAGRPGDVVPVPLPAATPGTAIRLPLEQRNRHLNGAQGREQRTMLARERFRPGSGSRDAPDDRSVFPERSFELSARIRIGKQHPSNQRGRVSAHPAAHAAVCKYSISDSKGASGAELGFSRAGGPAGTGLTVGLHCSTFDNIDSRRRIA